LASLGSHYAQVRLVFNWNPTGPGASMAV